MERETKTIITPVDQINVVIKSWLTGREKREIGNIYLENTDFNSEDAGFKAKGSLLSKVQDKELETVVISVNEKTEKIIDLCLDLKTEDYDFIINEVEKVVNPNESKKK